MKFPVFCIKQVIGLGNLKTKKRKEKKEAELMTKEAASSHWRPDPIKNQAKSSACIGQQLEKSDSWFTAAGESEFLLGINGNPAQIQLSRRLIWPRMHRMPYYLPISLRICLNLDDALSFRTMVLEIFPAFDDPRHTTFRIFLVKMSLLRMPYVWILSKCQAQLL